MSDNARKGTASEHAPVSRKGQVLLTADYGVPNFKWQMFFNAFSVEKCSSGVLLRVAYMTKNTDNQHTASEIIPIVLSREGLQQMAEGSRSYIADFGNVAPYLGATLPAVRQFSPLFANHIRMSRTGGTGEMAFYTVPIMDIALAVQGKLAAGSKVNCVHVALLHSDMALHEQLAMALISEVA